MKFVYIILLACLFAFVSAENICIKFYKKPLYKEYIGQICDEIDPGKEHGDADRTMTVGSFKAPCFLQVTLYEKKDFNGNRHVYKGDQKDITPAVHVGSVEWKNLLES